MILTGGLTQPEWSPCRTVTNVKAITFAKRRETAAVLPDLSSDEDDDDCSEWRKAKDTVYRTHLCFLKFDLEQEQVSDNDVTFVAQVSQTISTPTI